MRSGRTLLGRETWRPSSRWPTVRGGRESTELAAERGAVDRVIVGLLFMGGLRRAGFRTVIDRRHREISRLRHDPGHRPKRMVQLFSTDVFDIIEASPGRLREVAGIGPTRANRITAAWADQKMIREIMVFLYQHGVGTARAVRIFKTAPMPCRS